MIRVLIADDEGIERMALCRRLEKHFGDTLCICQAEDGAEAVELFKREKSQIAIMDIAMPVLNGVEAAEQILQVGAAGQEPVGGGAQLCFIAGAVLFCLVLNVALALVPAGDDDRQAMLLADPVAGTADEVIAPLIGVIVLVVLKADRIENQVVMNVVFVYVGGEDKFIFAAQDLPRQFHADPVGFLRRDLPRLKRLDEVAAQVRALVDSMAAGPCKFNVGGFRGAAEGGHQ